MCKTQVDDEKEKTRCSTMNDREVPIVGSKIDKSQFQSNIMMDISNDAPSTNLLDVAAARASRVLVLTEFTSWINSSNRRSYFA